MKLPSRSDITNEQQLLVYLHDIQELHGARNTPVRIKYLRQYELVLRSVRENEPFRILDVGCAQGNIAIGLSETGLDVVACDLRKSVLSYARMKDDSGNTRFVVADGYSLPFGSGSFDCVIVGDLVEHLAYPENLLRECRRVLMEEGLLILTTPNGRNIFSRLPTFAEMEDRISLAEVECQQDADGHLFLFTADELATLLEEFGFFVDRVHLMKSSLINNHIEQVFEKVPLQLSLKLDWLLGLLPGLRDYLSEELILIAKKRSN